MNKKLLPVALLLAGAAASIATSQAIDLWSEEDQVELGTLIFEPGDQVHELAVDVTVSTLEVLPDDALVVTFALETIEMSTLDADTGGEPLDPPVLTATILQGDVELAHKELSLDEPDVLLPVVPQCEALADCEAQISLVLELDRPIGDWEQLRMDALAHAMVTGTTPSGEPPPSVEVSIVAASE